MFRTQTVAAAVDNYLGDVRNAGPIPRPPRRRSGPRPGEETVDYQIDLDPTRSKRVHDVAAKISDGDFSAVIRAVLDTAFLAAGFQLGPRPQPLSGLVDLIPSIPEGDATTA